MSIGRTGLAAAACGGLAAGAILVRWHVALAPYAFDDAYIHFRIAANLLEWGRPYFNPDQPLLATSAPLWTLVVAGVFAAVGREPVAVSVLDALLLGAGGVAWTAVVRGFGAARLAAAAFAVVYVGWVHHASVGAMETPLALLLVAAGLLVRRRAPALAAGPLALAVFVRAETVLYVVALGALDAWRRRGIPWGAAGVTALVALPLLLAELAWFGTVIPHPVAAKTAVYDVAVSDTLRLLWHDTASLLPLGGAPLGLALGALALGILAVEAARAGRGKAPPGSGEAWSVLAIGVVTLLAYVAFAGLVFPWYVPLVAVPLHAGLWGLALRGRFSPSRSVAVVLLTAPLLVGLARTAIAASGRPELFAWFAENARVRRYLEVGAELGRRWPGATLVSSEIGALGFAFTGRLVDGAGLVSPEALKYHPMQVGAERAFGFVGAIPPGFVAEVRPELIVSLETFVEAFERSGPREAYRVERTPIYVAEDLARVPDAELWGSRSLNVYVRADLAGAAEAP